MTSPAPHDPAPHDVEPHDTTGGDRGEAACATLASELLAEVASSYQSLITRTDLAARLQQDSDTLVRRNSGTWLDRVLALAAADDVAHRRPPLTSLVVHKADGMVGASYDEVLRLTGQPALPDALARERHAAEARMDCYRWAGADMPAGGGRAALSPRYDQVLTRERRKAREEAEVVVCPTCFMAVPPTGECDTCA